QVKVYRALFTFDPRTPDELYFEEGDILYISDTSDSNWWKGTCRGRTGLIPSNYVAEQAESIDNPLHEAAKRGNLSWLRECLDNKVGINGLDKAGNTALYWACHGGHKDVVELLLGHANIELNQQNKLGDTALHAAAWKGYADIVEMLLNKNARTDVLNNEKKLALDMATNAQCASLLKRKLGSKTETVDGDRAVDTTETPEPWPGCLYGQSVCGQQNHHQLVHPPPRDRRNRHRAIVGNMYETYERNHC
ncbi:osteoclast-stimulating factor 1-like, partial [Scleropages formosus]